MELAPGVYQFKLPIPDNPLVPDSTLGEAFAYLVETEDGYVLVDAGWNNQDTFDSLLTSIAETGVNPASIRWIVITHYHPDHFGLAQKLRELSGAKIVMHRLDLPDNIRKHYLSHTDAASNWMKEWQLSQGMSEPDVTQIPPPKKGIDIFLPAINVDITLKGGEKLDDGNASLEVIWTPGHTEGHICLYDKRRKLLFSGDQLLPKITPHISVHPHTHGNPLGDYLNSLDKLDSLDVCLVLPGHEYAFPNFHSRIKEIKYHHQIRAEETRQALQEGPQTPYQVASHLKWNIGPWEKISPFNKQMAMFEALAHLRHLQQQGEVHTFKVGSTDFYEKD